MAQESLPSNVVSSAQVLANVANLLNIRDTELSRKRKLTDRWRRFSQPITQDSKNSQRPSLGTKRSVSLNKKQEGVQISQAQPAEDWLRRATKVLSDDVFSSVEYATLLKEA